MFLSTTVFLLFLTTAMIRADNIPPRPKIPESFSTWYFAQSMASDPNDTSLNDEEQGYIARDMKGARQLMNYSDVSKIEGVSIYSQLDLFDKNETYMSQLNMTSNDWMCHMSNSSWEPMWEWVQYAEYFGSYLNVDEWIYTINTTEYSFTLVLGVSKKDPNLPLVFLFYNDTITISFIFSGFDPNYKPNDSDFELPPTCDGNFVTKVKSPQNRNNLFGRVSLASKKNKTDYKDLFSKIKKEMPKNIKFLEKQKLMKRFRQV